MKAFSETPSKAIIFYSHFLHTGMSAASLLRLSGVQLFLPLNELENIWRSSRICPQILILLPFLLLSQGCFSHLGLDFQNESRGPGISRLGAETAIKLQRRAFWQRCSSVIFRRVTERLKKALGVDNRWWGLFARASARRKNTYSCIRQLPWKGRNHGQRGKTVREGDRETWRICRSPHKPQHFIRKEPFQLTSCNYAFLTTPWTT